ncbi:MAG: glycosyltransferase family 1 protein [Cyanobacteria bacterium J06621_8]
MQVVIVRREPKVAFSMDVYADNLVAELKQLKPDWTITEISPQPWSNNLENLWHSGNPLRKYYERFYNHPREVNQLDADLFHIIDHTNAHLAYGLKKQGKNVVVTCHDLVQYVYPEILKNAAKFPAFSMAVWQYCVKGITVADRTIAISSNTAKDVTHWLNIDANKIDVVPNGVGTEFKPIAKESALEWRKQYTESPDEICLLNIGTNHQRKNIETVLKVVKEIADLNLPVRLWKVGEDFYDDQKQYIKDNNIADKITMINSPDQSALIKFYNAADVLVAPSLYEGFGLTILEAMSCGTPTITSNVSALPEVAGDAAILVDPNDVSAITQAVLQITQDAALRQILFDKGLARVKQFSWKETAKQTAAVYEQVAKLKNKVLA